MKQLVYTFILITLCFTQARSQDLIVTTRNDSLNCRITRIYGSDIHFFIVKENVLKDSLLNTDQVKYYHINYFVGGYGFSPNHSIKLVQYPPKFRIHIGAGYSRLLKKIPKYLPGWEVAYRKNIRSSYHTTLHINYYTYRSSGFGMKYSLMKTSAQADNIDFMRNGIVVGTGLLRDDITVQFIGPTFFGDVRIGKRKSFLLSNQIALRYISFLNKAIQVERFDIISNTLGGSWDLSLDYFITKRLSVGVDFSYTLGGLNEKGIDYLPSIYGKGSSYTYTLDLSRVDLGFGIKGYLGTL